MKKKINLHHIRQYERFPFKYIDFFNGLFLLLPVVLVCLSFLMIRSYTVNNMTDLNGLLLTAIGIGILGITFFVVITKRLIENMRFTKYFTGVKFERNLEVIEKVFNELYDNDSIDKSRIEKGLIISFSGISFLSWGSINTVVCNENEVLINSRPTDQPITVYENKLNIKRIIKKIEKELKPAHNNGEHAGPR